MTSLYLIRHAQAQGNVEKRFQGRINLPLTEEGRKQSRQLAQRMQAIPLEAVYTSPLRRAWDTALPVAATRKQKPILCPQLIEIDGGDFENHLFAELQDLYPLEFGQFVNEPHKFAGVGGGESLADVYLRMQETILQLVQRHAGFSIAAITHGAALRCYLCYVMDLPLERLNEVGWTPNTGVTHIIFDRELRPTLRYTGDDSHLRVKMLEIAESY